jgi:hypothetical protein
MKKPARVTPTASKHKAYVPLERSALKDEAERLVQLFIKTFTDAPESDFLLKYYYLNLLEQYYDKRYLQDNVFFIPRADFLWFFSFYLGKHEEQNIELKKRSASKDEMEIEQVAIHQRRYYKVEEEPVDIIYTRFFEDGSGETTILKNTIGAVALSEKVLADFCEDRVTRYPIKMG